MSEKVVQFRPKGGGEGPGDRWQELEVIAHKLDGETTSAAVVAAMREVLKAFPGSVEPDADLAGFAVNHLANAVIRAIG